MTTARPPREPLSTRPCSARFARGGSGGGGADISPLGKAQVPLMNLWQDTTHYFDYHHSAADTLDKVDPGDLARNVAAMAVMAYLLAESETPLPRQEPPALPEHRMHPDSK